MSCLNAVKVVRQSPPLLLMIMCPRGGTRAQPHPGKSITPPTQAVVRWRYPSLSLPLPPDTLPQRQQPAAGTHRHKAHAAHRAQLHKHCAKVTRAPQKRGLLPSAVVPRLSALVYAAPFDYGVHCPPRERRRRQLDRQSQRLRVRESTSAYLRATRFLRGSAMSRACVAQRMRL